MVPWNATPSRACAWVGKGVGAHRLTGFGAAQFHDMAPGGGIAEIVVEADHAMHLGPAQVQPLGDARHRLARDMAKGRLHRMQDRQQRPLAPGMFGENVIGAVQNRPCW